MSEPSHQLPLESTVVPASPATPAGKQPAVPPQDAAQTDSTWEAPSPPKDAVAMDGSGTRLQTTPPHALLDPPLPQVPGYDLLALLGRGGMGIVYKARHQKLQRLVALKMIRAGSSAGPEQLQRFRTEAEAIARVQHPHIVQLFEIGAYDGLPFFALEYCSGGSLDKKLAGTPLPPAEAAALVQRLAQAVDAAHAKNIIHRDLKPANVLLTEDGTPKITDFGLAKKLDTAGQTTTGEVIGTPSYMAPEQARGQGKTLGPACDIYALGAILYECLTGRPPFKAATPLDTLVQVVNDEPVAVTQLNGQVARDLETICHQCLQKEPGKRYASAAALVEDLGRFGRGEPIQARPVSTVERGVKWVRRNPMVATLAATVLWVLLAGAGVSTYFGMAASQEAEQATAARKEAEENAAEARQNAAQAKHNAEKAQQSAAEAKHNEENAQKSAAEAKHNEENAQKSAAEAKRNEEEAKRAQQLAQVQLRRAEGLVYASKLSLSQQAFQDGNTLLALSYLNQCQWDLRGWEHRYLWTRFNSKQTFRGHTGIVSSVAYSADGKRLASASWDRTVKVWDAGTGQVLLTLQVPYLGTIAAVTFSGDGKRLAGAGADKTVKVWDAGTGQQLLTLQGHTDRVSSVAFSGDGKRLASASWDKTVKVWDAGTGQVLLTLNGHADRVDSVAFSGDSKRLASAGKDGTVKVWDAATGQELLAKRHADWVHGVAFSAEGKRLASAGKDGTVKVWDTATGQELLTLKGHTGAVEGVAFSGDSKRLASAGKDGTVKVWDAATGQELQVLKGHTGPVNSVAFSPDGQRLASASQDQTVKVWDAQKGQDVLALKGHTNYVMGVAFSVDGKRLASAGADQTVKVWDAVTGQELRVLQGHADAVTSVAYSADGKCLASASADKTVKVWDAATGQELRVLQGHTGPVASVAFGADGKRLASAGADQTVKVWDAATGQQLLTLKGHTGAVGSLAYSADGKRLASASAGAPSSGKHGEVTVWDADTGQLVLSLQGHTAYVNSVAFSGDGKRLATASWDGTVKLWDVD
jgi:WD40 repeat protein/tRNA A-37 threonylcarbamoyl transferase component Bud32